MEPVSQFGGHSPQCLFYHRDHIGLEVRTFLPAVLSTPWYFSIFLCSFFQMLLSSGIATTTITAFFCCQSITTTSGWLVSSSLSAWSLKSHRTLALVFSSRFGGVSHRDMGTSTLLIHSGCRCSCTFFQLLGCAFPDIHCS